MLAVNELFQTIQGEAGWTGTPSVFVRLQGCDVGCPWCDTRHTWNIDESLEISLSAMLDKTADAPRYAIVGTATLVGAIEQFQARHVVITGGEPAQYDLVELTTLLINSRRSVQIETSGTEPIRVNPATWVTVSPKIGMPGGKVVSAEALLRADEIKLPVGRLADIERFRILWATTRIDAVKAGITVGDPIVWLQPLSQNRKATDLCIAAATEHEWRVSLQTHKFISIR